MTVSAPDLYPRKRADRYTKARDEFLQANREIDPAILADQWGVTERFIIGYQRKLGIRKLTGNPPRKKK